jgi:hypothetical protein
VFLCAQPGTDNLALVQCGAQLFSCTQDARGNYLGCGTGWAANLTVDPHEPCPSSFTLPWDGAGGCLSGYNPPEQTSNYTIEEWCVGFGDAPVDVVNGEIPGGTAPLGPSITMTAIP